jgi:RNA polymerase sigma-70 factor (ECF subfamily)
MRDARARLEEELLVLRSQDGDRDAFGQLVDYWQPRLFAHAWRLTGDEEAAWDVVQDTWMAALGGIKRLGEPRLFAPWLFKIAANKCADWVHRRGRRRKTERELSRDMPAPAPPSSESRDVLDAARSLLPRQTNALLALYYIEGFTAEEIGGILGIPAGTVKSRLFYARAELKRKVERLDNE